MKTPSISEIAVAIGKLFENARELLEEAELLLSHERFARAYTLAHLASEEIAKIPWLVDKAMATTNGEEWTWEDVDSYSHKKKIRRGLHQEIIQTFFTSTGEIDIEKLKKANEIADALNELKNSSLYVSLIDATKPSEVISKDRATEAIEITRRRLQQFEELEFHNSTQTEQRIIEFSRSTRDAPGYLKFLLELHQQAVQDLAALAKSGALGPGAYEQLVDSGLLDKVTSFVVVQTPRE